MKNGLLLLSVLLLSPFAAALTTKTCKEPHDNAERTRYICSYSTSSPEHVYTLYLPDIKRHIDPKYHRYLLAEVGHYRIQDVEIEGTTRISYSHPDLKTLRMVLYENGQRRYRLQLQQRPGGAFSRNSRVSVDAMLYH